MAGGGRTRAKPRLLSRTYALTCAATLAFYLALQMQVPVFPDFLRQRAGSSDAAIGLFIGAFAGLAVLARPLVGRALGRRTRRGFMAAGGLVTAVASIGYATSHSFAILMAVRLAHGMSVAFFYTAASTLVTDVSPVARRGEALSYFSMFLYFGLAGGPALGLTLSEWRGFNAMFLASIVLGCVCAAIALVIEEDPPKRPEEEHAPLPLIHRRALFPGAVLALAAVGYAAALNFTADFASHARITGRAAYFPILALSVVVTRAFCGRLSDRYGRVVVAAPGLALFAGAMALESAARSAPALLGSAALFGTGFGMFFPTMLAFTADRVPPRERGSALATYTASFDVGMGLGSPLLGAVKGAHGYPVMYATAAGLAVASLATLMAGAGSPRLQRAASQADT